MFGERTGKKGALCLPGAVEGQPQAEGGGEGSFQGQEENKGAGMKRRWLCF